MKEYRVVYNHKGTGTAIEAGQNGWIPSKEIADKILSRMQGKSFYRDTRLYLVERESENSSALSWEPCRTHEGKTVYNPDWLYCDALQIGDLVDDKVVDNFMNCLPPACMRSDCAQLGEAYSIRIDENGKARSTYLTFRQINKATWEYCGDCFIRENEQRGTEPSYI